MRKQDAKFAGASASSKLKALKGFRKSKKKGAGGRGAVTSARAGGNRDLSDKGYGSLSDMSSSAPEKKGGVPKVSGRSVERKSDSLKDGVMNQLATDHAVESHVRERKQVYEDAGVPVTREQLKNDVEEFAAQQGIDPDQIDAGESVERALNSVASPEPEALGDYAKKVFDDFEPLTAERKAEIIKRVENPPPKKFVKPSKPNGPPPKGTIAAYQRDCETFKWVEDNLGVKPHHVLSILKTETNLGSYTGKHPVMETLRAVHDKGGPKKKRSMERNMAALIRLGEKGRLGKYDPNTITGSYAGAFGIAQFMPASWEAYSRDKNGEGDDPFSYEDAIVSAANYLKIHGYSKDVKKSFWAYNHSTEYVEKVNSTAERIKPGLKGCP
jgi:membrane-bound lytic murein transglycosylase B